MASERLVPSARIVALANFSNQTISMGNNGSWVVSALAPNNVADAGGAMVPPFAPTNVTTINWNNQTIAIWQNEQKMFWANWTSQPHTPESGIELFTFASDKQYRFVLCANGTDNSLSPAVVEIH